MLDRLPAPVRHFVIAFLGSASLVLVSAINDAKGVTSVAWASVLTDALNAGIVAAVSLVGVMYLTPLTRQYGVGANATPVDAAIYDETNVGTDADTVAETPQVS